MGEQKDADWYDRDYERGRWRQEWWMLPWAPLWSNVATKIRHMEPDFVIDLGCGVGFLGDMLHPIPYAGLDISRVAVTVANQRRGKNVCFVQDVVASPVKVNFPKFSDNDKAAPAPYNELKLGEVEAFRQVVESAGNSFVLVSGGSKISDEDLLDKVRWSMEAGATGLIFGRNMWQRPMDEALALTAKVKEIMAG